MRMASEWRGDEPELREEIREARGRVFELLGSVIMLSILLGLAINLGSTLLAERFDAHALGAIIAACAAVPVLFALVLLPRLSTTIKEFHEEIEIVLPLLIGTEDLEVLRITHYQDISETAHAALARRPAEERKQLAETLRRGQGENDHAGRQAVTAAALELTQFLFAVRVVQESRRLLGPEALYHKFREVARAQSSTAQGDWAELARQAPGNRYLTQKTSGVPERTLLPGGVSLTVPEVAPLVFGKQEQRRAKTRGSTIPGQEVDYVTLVAADAGRDTALRISALATFSEHRLPAQNAPHRGLTARCVLRNAREPWLHDLAHEEEETAERLNEHGRALHAPAEGEPDPTELYSRLYTRLYGGVRKFRLLRIYIRFDGAFRIRLLSNDVGQRGLYLWGTALSRMLARLDIEYFMATLKEHGQKVPKRIF
jgi:hypothetical protein